MMQDNVGIFRDEAGLVTALGKLEEYKERRQKVHVPVGARAWNPAGTSAVTSRTCSPSLRRSRARR